MNKINNWITSNIVIISLYFSISALLLTFATMLFGYDGPMQTIRSIFEFNPVYLLFLQSDFFSILIQSSENSYYSFSILTMLYQILFLVGAIVYMISNTKEKRLLQFCFALVFIYSILNPIFYSYYLFENTDKINAFVPYTYLKGIVTIYVSYIILNHLSDAKAQKIEEENRSYYALEFETYTPKHLRIFHYIFDGFLIVLIFSNIVFYNLRETFSSIDSQLGVSLVFAMFSTIYYLFFEGIFKTTPAKYLTQSFVMNTKSELLNFPTILGRTFARRIPLNALSFFTKKGWHDDFSNTTVVQKGITKKYNVLYWFIFASFIFYVLIKLVLENL